MTSEIAVTTRLLPLSGLGARRPNRDLDDAWSSYSRLFRLGGYQCNYTSPLLKTFSTEVMASPAPSDPMLLQPNSNLPPPSLDPREPAPPAITSPGGHIQTSRNRSTGTPRAPRTPTRSPARSAASSRATSPVLGLGTAKRGERGSFGTGAHGLHPAHLSAGSALTSGNSSRVESASSSRRDSGNSGVQHGMGIITNSIDAALASGAKGNQATHNPHLPTSPLSEASPPISPSEGLAVGLTQPNALAPRSRPLSGTTSPRARSSSQFASRSIHPSADAHPTGTIPASTFFRPVSPALSATASISDSMIFERDIESPLPPPVPSSVLDRRPSRRGSRASGLNGSAGHDHAPPAGHSLAHSQTHSHSNLHHHYTHGDFLESKIPTVLDDAIEALTALSESEKQQQASGVSGVRTRLVDIEVESPVPVALNWTSVGSSVPGGRISGAATPRHQSRPASPLRSGVTSPKASHPTSPLLSAEQTRPQLSSRTSSIGPMLPGAFPSGEEHKSDSWRRKIQDWIGPKGLDDEKPGPDLEKKEDNERKDKVQGTSPEEKEVHQVRSVCRLDDRSRPNLNTRSLRLLP